MKPFLILQLRPETEASDDEFAAILRKGGLREGDVTRIRLDQQDLPEGLDLDDFSGVIVGGGPGCISDPPEAKSATEARIEAAIMSLMPEITTRDFPYLGCCYGIGILGHHLGSAVSKARFGEPVGTSDCVLTSEGRADPICDGMPDAFQAFVGHKEAVQALPEGCSLLISSPACPIQMIRAGENVYATQFHPEADGQVFADRIRIYRDRGYFMPDEAEALTVRMLASAVTEPVHILRRFVQRYL